MSFGEWDIQLQDSELSEQAFINALTTRRDSLLKRLSEAPPVLEELLLLRAEATVLRAMYKETGALLGALRAEKTKHRLATSGVQHLLGARRPHGT